MPAPDLQITRTTWDGLDAVEIRSGTDLLAQFALRGATPLRWRPTVGGKTWDALDGYADAAEFEAQAGVRNGMMAPFVNRVAGARYSFDGEELDLLPGSADRLIYHGLTRQFDFTLSRTDVHDGVAHLRFDCDTLRGSDVPGYPFDVDVSIEYAVGPTRFDVAITATNVGTRAAPFGSGWHPYLAFPDRTIDGLELAVPAGARVRTDEALIPVAGPTAVVPLGADDPLDFRALRAVGDARFDACWTSLRPDPDGLIRSQVRDPGHRLELELWQERGNVHGFTGHTLARAPRTSLAVEPVDTLTNAFNRPDQADLLRLEPGQQRSFRFGLEAKAI